MATLVSKLDLNYVPSPPVVIDQIARRLQLPEKLSALDPCCGEGDALARLCPGAKTHGVELEAGRAMAAMKKLTTVLGCAVEEARVSHKSFGLALLNPPYDDSTAGRLELTFLERVTPWLVPGGVLVYIIKHERYNQRVFTHLARHYDAFEHWRFPDGYFAGPELAFGQTVLLARRADREQSPGLEALARKHCFLPGMTPPEVPPGTELWQVPPGRDPFLFSAARLSAPMYRALLQASPIRRRPENRPSLACGRPPLPLGTGHLALVLAGGIMDGVYAHGGEPHVCKGTVERRTLESVDFDETAGGKTVRIETKTEIFLIRVRCLNAEGTIHDVSGGKPAAAEDAEEAA